MQKQAIPQQKNYYYILISLIAAISGILFGYDTGVISGAILFIRKDFALHPALEGIVVSSVLVGAFFGALFSGKLTDKVGRKRILILVACVFIFGSIETALALDVPFLIIGRVLVGIAIGIASYTAPLYISEIAPPKYRGALVSLNQLAIAIGIFISYVVDYFLSFESLWRWMLGLGVVPAVILLIGMLFLPYSPRWMVFRGKAKEAKKILEKIRGSSATIDQELAAIEETLKHHQTSWKSLFSKKIAPVVTIGICLAVIQQVTGINTILYYAPTIFEMTGYASNTSSILATMGVGVIFVVFTLIALPLIDSLGRRPLLLIGLIGMAIGLLSLSYLFLIGKNVEFQHLALFSMLLYIASFAVSLGPIMWLMIAEIYPLKVRGMGASFATCINWLSNFAVALTFPILLKSFSPSGTFFLYFLATLLSILFIYFFVPETKGIPLETIEDNLYAGKPWRKLGK